MWCFKMINQPSWEWLGLHQQNPNPFQGSPDINITKTGGLPLFLVHSPKRGMVSSLKWPQWFSQAEKNSPLLAYQNPFTNTSRKLTWHIKTHENDSNQPFQGGHISIGKPHHFIGKLILGIWALYQPTNLKKPPIYNHHRPVSHIAPRTTNDPWWSALNITHRWSRTWQGWTCRMHWTGGICSWKQAERVRMFFSFFLREKVVMFLKTYLFEQD